MDIAIEQPELCAKLKVLQIQLCVFVAHVLCSFVKQFNGSCGK